MKRTANFKNNSQLSRSLGITPQALSNCKKRGIIPAYLIIKFAGIYSTSVDWLLTGEGKSEAARLAARQAAPCGREAEKRLLTISPLSPEELVYVEKLLKVMRSPDRSAVSVLMWTLDAFLKAVEENE
ncbi:MAG TPA: helix-turn-helix domain-containing protein [Thermodesulfobacteriota bacterium]|nr:helix-turn-helix domain-containing protein [Thermodesulfobacteriota bacterium]